MTRNTAIDHLETDQFAGQTAGLLLFHQFAVDELLAIDELGQPVQARLDRRSRIVDIITVEAETHLQTQRVAGTEADIFQPLLRTLLPESLPEFLAVFVGHIDLAAARTGVSRNRKNRIHTGNLQLLERIVFHILNRLGAQLLHDLHRIGTLDRQLADLVRSVVELLAMTGLQAEFLALFDDMVPILVDISRIDYEQISFGIDPVNQQVVHDTSLAVGHGGILHLPVVKRRNIVGRDMLQERFGLGTFYPDLAHVTHVEYTRVVAHGQVLFVDARKFDRHVVTCELGHLSAVRNVMFGKNRCFHCLLSI